MLKFELLNIFLFQHPKDGLDEESNTNQICVIRGDQFFDKPEDGTEEYFVSEPDEFDYWDYWVFLKFFKLKMSLFDKIIGNHRIPIYNADVVRFQRTRFYGNGNIFEPRCDAYSELKAMFIRLNSRFDFIEKEMRQMRDENNRQFDFIKRGMRLMIGQMRRMNGRFDALEREMGQMQQTLTLTSLQSDVSLFMVRTNEDELRNIEARLATIEARLEPQNVDNLGGGAGGPVAVAQLNNVAAGAGGVAHVNNVGVEPVGPPNVDNNVGGGAGGHVAAAHVNNVGGGAGGGGQNNNVGEE